MLVGGEGPFRGVVEGGAVQGCGGGRGSPRVWWSGGGAVQGCVGGRGSPGVLSHGHWNMSCISTAVS